MKQIKENEMKKHYLLFSDGTVKAFFCKDKIEDLKNYHWVPTNPEVSCSIGEVVALAIKGQCREVIEDLDLKLSF